MVLFIVAAAATAVAIPSLDEILHEPWTQYRRGCFQTNKTIQYDKKVAATAANIPFCMDPRPLLYKVNITLSRLQYYIYRTLFRRQPGAGANDCGAHESIRKYIWKEGDDDAVVVVVLVVWWSLKSCVVYYLG